VSLAATAFLDLMAVEENAGMVGFLGGLDLRTHRHFRLDVISIKHVKNLKGAVLQLFFIVLAIFYFFYT